MWRGCWCLCVCVCVCVCVRTSFVLASFSICVWDVPCVCVCVCVCGALRSNHARCSLSLSAPDLPAQPQCQTPVSTQAHSLPQTSNCLNGLSPSLHPSLALSLP